jgi:hypothetical protein
VGESKQGEEFIKHEMDEAIAVQSAIVEAERQLGAGHPFPAAKTAIKGAMREDERLLRELQTLGKPFGATGMAEEVAGALQALMQQTAGSATEAPSEAYEAHAVLINLKRKQQDSGSAMAKLGRARKDATMRDAGVAFERAQRTSATALAKELAAFAVVIAQQPTGR